METQSQSNMNGLDPWDYCWKQEYREKRLVEMKFHEEGSKDFDSKHRDSAITDKLNAVGSLP